MAAAMQRRKLLILANDRARRRELEAVFSDLDVTACEASDQALVTVRRTEPDAVLFDLGTEREPAVAAQTLELLRQILNISPDTKIIAMIEHDARELAVAAVGLGATDFYHKPLDGPVLSIVVRRALRIRELEEENWRLRERTGSMALEGIIGVSDAMRSVCRAIEKVAPTNATVLLLGDSGTGKDLLARALHRLSGRAHKPFAAINCAAIPDTLLESELFGYEKGAFTGAGKPTRGLAPDAIRAIQAHPWPGNVRELENRIKGAVIMAEGAVVTAGDLGLEDPGDEPEYLNLRVARQRAEAQAVRQSLAVARGNLSRAAELLGVTRPTLYDLLGKHSIEAAQFGRHATPAKDTGSAD